MIKNSGSMKFAKLLIMLSVFAVGKLAYADNVAMTETSKFLAPETVNMLVQRANSGGAAGFQVGDTVKYIIKYKPVPNGGNTGVNGYITDYIPSGLQVIDAAFVQPDGFGGYFEVPPFPAGDMANHPDGNGNRFQLPPVGFAALPATPANLILAEAAGINGPAGNLDFNGLPTSTGTMAQWYADVGIWYSTDIRTAFNPLAPVNSSRNIWDASQVDYENICAQNNGGAEGPWGTGSPVAGPETFYQREIPAVPAFPCTAGAIGPWHRIAVEGSRIGAYGLMGDLQASNELFPGDPLYGRDTLLNPLPVASALTPVTIRWANGLNSVGEVKYVSLTAQIASLPPGGTIINNSEVWGGDVFGGEGGKDNAWKYNDTLVSIGNNSDLTIIKIPSVESAATGDVVSFQVTVINTGANPQQNVVVTDYLNTSYEPGNAPPAPGLNGNPFYRMSYYNCDASGGATFGTKGIGLGGIVTPAACPVVNPLFQSNAVNTNVNDIGTGDETVAGAEVLQWNVGLLNPGQSFVFSYSVTAVTAPVKGKVTSASDTVVATSTQLIAPGARSAASFEIGTFPILVQTKTVTPSSVLPGGTVRYHIQIVNNGSGSAGGYIDPGSLIAYAPYDINLIPMPTSIVDTLPAGFSYAGNLTATLDGAILTPTVSAVGNSVTFNINHVPLVGVFPQPPVNMIWSGSVIDVYFDALVNPSVAPGVYTNTVFSNVPYNKKPKANNIPEPQQSAVAGNKTDWANKPLYSFNTAPVTVGAVQMAMVASPQSVTNTPTGTSTTYTITVTNNGAIAATGISITDVLPAGFSFQVGSTSGTAGVGAPAVAGQSVTWPAFSVPAGSSRTIIFNADISSLTLPAAYWSDVTATATNAAIPELIHTTPVVVSNPGLTVAKTVDEPVITWLGDGAVVAVSDIVNYTITLKNSGAGYAIVDVADTLPAGFFFPQLGTETITLTVNGVPQVLTRAATNTATTYNKWPGSVLAVPPVDTRTPSWGTFTIPPKQGGVDTVLTITFAARIDMQDIPGAAITVTQPGIYNNTVTVAGNVNVPAFIGAPVEVLRPAIKWTTTPSVAVNGLVDYRIQVANHDSYTWTGVSVVDYLGALTTAGIAPPVPSGAVFSPASAFYAIGVSAPVGLPGVDPLWLATVPTVLAPNVTFDNAAVGFSIPAGQNLFIAYKAVAPAAVPVPANIHNSLQTLSYTSNAIVHVVNNAWDGGLAANNGEDVTITLTPSVNLTGTKTVTPSSLYLYGAAAANAVTYSITLNNTDALISATGVTITDTLPPGFSFAVGDTATVSINAGAPIALTPIYTPPVAPAVQGTLSIPLGANLIPPLGNAVITFTTSVAALTGANTYYNSASWLGTNVTPSSVGPTAPVVIDPVTVSKQALTPSAVAGGVAKYRISIVNSGNQPLNALSVTDTFGSLVPLLASGFTYNSDITVTMNGTALVAGVDYTAPLAASAAPVWTFITPVAAGTITTASVVNIDFYANVPPAAIGGTVANNSISNLSFTPGILLPVIVTNLYDGGVPANTADDVTISSLGISKAVVTPYATVTNVPVLGTLTKYVISVNNTTGLAQLVDIIDTLPTGFSYQLGSTLINGLPAVDPVVLLQTLTWAGQNAAIGVTTLQFTALIAGTVPPAVYNNQAQVFVGGLAVNSFSGAPVTVLSPQTFLSKITTTPSIGKDIYGNYTPAHYRLTMTNVGSAAATGVTIADLLPVGFTYDPYSFQISINGVDQAAGTYAVPAPLLGTFTFTTLPAGGFTVPAAAGGVNGQITIEYDALIAPATVPLLAGHVNSATSASTNAGAQGPAIATVNLYDVGLSKTTTTPALNAGQTASYTIFVSNFGAAAIANLVVSDFLPTGFSYVALSTTGLGWIPTEPIVVGNQLDWTIPSLPANSTATITFSALVLNTTTPNIYRNSVVASGNGGLLLFPNTGPTAPITVTAPQPLLTVLKLASAPTVNPGDTIIYTVLVSNTGTGVAKTVEIADTLSPLSKLALTPFAPANTTIFSFADGVNPSGLPGTALLIEFSNDNGVNFNYTPVDDGTGHDPAITNFRIIMDGIMNANQAAAPGFSIQYQAQVE